MLQLQQLPKMPYFVKKKQETKQTKLRAQIHVPTHKHVVGDLQCEHTKSP